MNNFYKELHSFNDFKEIFQKEYQVEVPNDWFVLITDIKNSTFFVNSGKYRDVNLIGAACISSVNKIGSFPYSFGGDGSSFVIPPEKITSVKNELLKLKKTAKNKFGLELRIGVVPVSLIKEKNKSIKISKFQIAENKTIAKFYGGGLEFADHLIKNDETFQFDSISDQDFDFSDLSCRWNPLKNKNGLILTLIIKSDNDKSYKNFLNNFLNIIDNDLESINPIKESTMTYKGIFQLISSELKLYSVFSFKFYIKIIEIIFCYLIFKIFKNNKPKNIEKYMKNMKFHSDFKKFDDSLRMVIDCSIIQKNKIIHFLEDEKSIKYGYHISDQALMTCLVYNINNGNHIHFIDGDNGGYTMAAKMLKNK